MMIMEKKFFILRRAVMNLTPQKAQEFYMEHKGSNSAPWLLIFHEAFYRAFLFSAAG